MGVVRSVSFLMRGTAIGRLVVVMGMAMMMVKAGSSGDSGIVQMLGCGER
jgi:uncharacterized membrane protein